MIGTGNYSNGKMSLQHNVQKDYMMVSVSGDEVYQLTDKATGKMLLVSFESKVAANRFFAENAGYFFSKIN